MKTFDDFIRWFTTLEVRVGFWGTTTVLGLIGCALMLIPTPPTFIIGAVIVGAVLLVDLAALISLLVYVLKTDYELSKIAVVNTESDSSSEENEKTAEIDQVKDNVKTSQTTLGDTVSYKNPRLASSHPQVGSTDIQEQEDLAASI